VTGGETFAASGRRRLLRGREPGSLLRIDERGVTREAEGDAPVTILWERCEAAIRLPSRALVLHQRDGAWLKVSKPGWDLDPLPRIEALLPAGRIVPVCDRELAEAIERIAGERVKPDDESGAGFINGLPDVLASDEALVDFAIAYRRMTVGLLVITDRRVLWLTDKDGKGFELTGDVLASPGEDAGQLEIYAGGETLTLRIEPKQATESLALAIRELWTPAVL
jgi:hypothetical protein